VITARRTGSRVVIDADLRPGTSLYVDADWLPDEAAGEEPVVLAALRADGRSLTETRSGASLPVEDGAEDAARAAIAGVAWEAAQAARGATAEVIGRGAVAALVRSMLRDVATGEGVETVIDATGSTQQIEHALEALPELGTLVLAGEADDAGADIDVYRLIHVRGIRVIGVPGPLITAPHSSIDAPLPRPRRVLVGEPFDCSALWYEVSPPKCGSSGPGLSP